MVIRKDLDRIRTLTNLVNRREKEKLRQARLLKQYLDALFHPLSKHFESALEKIKK